MTIKAKMATPKPQPVDPQPADLEDIQTGYACELRQSGLVPRNGVVIDVGERFPYGYGAKGLTEAEKAVGAKYSYYDVTARFYVMNETQMQGLQRRVKYLEERLNSYVNETC
jgi:hypothetical protein